MLHLNPNAAIYHPNKLKSPKCDLCDENWADTFCISCKKSQIYAESLAPLLQKSANTGHQVSPWSIKQKKTKCATHNEECVIFCQQDQSIVGWLVKLRIVSLVPAAAFRRMRCGPHRFKLFLMRR